MVSSTDRELEVHGQNSTSRDRVVASYHWSLLSSQATLLEFSLMDAANHQVPTALAHMAPSK